LLFLLKWQQFKQKTLFLLFYDINNNYCSIFGRQL
jgi:hypothetical protein